MQCQLIHDDLNIIIYIKRKSKYIHTHTHTHTCAIKYCYDFFLKHQFIKIIKTSIKKIGLICIISPKWCKTFNKEIKGINNNDGFEKN
jgi:hypothetical protein